MARLIDRESGRVILERLRIARTTWQRMRGLLGEERLPTGEGMLIERCSCIHTFFMKFPLDLIFMDRHFRVKKVVRNVKPWRLAGARGAAKVVEMPAGQLNHAAPSCGETLLLEEGP